MKKIMWLLRLYVIILKMSIQSMISYYRWNYAAVYAAHIIGYLGSYTVIWAAMRMFDQVSGWSFYQVAFLYSIDLLSYSLAQSFLQPFWDMDNLVVRGGLDEYLTRPINPLVYLVTKNYNFIYIGHITVSMAVSLIVILKLDLSWNLLDWCWYAVVIISATLIQASITIIPSCLAFWFSRSDQLSGMLRWDIREYIKFPTAIYPLPIKLILTIVIPFAFVNYYPSLYLLHRELHEGRAQILLWLTPAVGAVLLSVSCLVWSTGIGRYEGSGS